MEDVKLYDARSRYKDTICVCGHWFEEHYVDGNVVPCDTCEMADKDDGLIGPPCKNFVFSPEDNTPEAIADRGGEHDLHICDCALCDFSRKRFIGEVREMFIRDEEWCAFENPGRIPRLLEDVDFGPRPHARKQ